MTDFFAMVGYVGKFNFFLPSNSHEVREKELKDLIDIDINTPSSLDSKLSLENLKLIIQKELILFIKDMIGIMDGGSTVDKVGPNTKFPCNANSKQKNESKDKSKNNDTAAATETAADSSFLLKASLSTDTTNVVSLLMWLVIIASYSCYCFQGSV